MPQKPMPDQDVLRAILRYDAATGTLTRFSRGAWRPAFTSKDARGYFHGKVAGKNYQAHRIIWKLVHGIDPDQIDHINGNPSDNRLNNLRSCTNAENARNYRKNPTGSSKFRGVCWVKRDQKWAASISDGKGGKVSLGYHKSELAAARAYDAAARKMHGQFATLNFPEARIMSALVQP